MTATSPYLNLPLRPLFVARLEVMENKAKWDLTARQKESISDLFTVRMQPRRSLRLAHAKTENKSHKTLFEQR
jgi:hypothetical protein